MLVRLLRYVRKDNGFCVGPKLKKMPNRAMLLLCLMHRVCRMTLFYKAINPETRLYYKNQLSVLLLLGILPLGQGFIGLGHYPGLGKQLA